MKRIPLWNFFDREQFFFGNNQLINLAIKQLFKLINFQHIN